MPPTPGYLLGIPTVAGSTSPRQIALIDASAIVVSYDDVISTDVSTTTSIEIDGAPTQSGISGTGTRMVSLFQNGLVALKHDLRVAWQPLPAAVGSPLASPAVAVMSVSY